MALSVGQFNRQITFWMTRVTKPGPHFYPWRQVFAYLRKETQTNFRAHRSPDGVPWAKAFSPFPLKVGDAGPVRVTSSGGVNSNNVRRRRRGYRWVKLTSGKQARAATRTAKRKNLFIKKGKSALFRPRGKFKARKLRDALTKDAIKYGLFRYQPKAMQYGFPPGGKWAQWVAPLHFGGSYKGKPVPARPLIGMTDKNMIHVLGLVSNRVMKELDKGFR